MTRIQWCVPALAAALLAACGTGDDSSAGPEPNPATGIVPPSAGPSASAAADWTMPTGVFRNDNPAAGVLELHVDPGSFRLYDVTDGTPDLGYAAECATDDPSTVTCTGNDGFQIVFAWSGTHDVMELTLPSGEGNDKAVFEGAQWTRVS
jgi:hypothetical protein